MRRERIGGLAAVVVALGLTATNASAAWVTPTAYLWEPTCSRYVPVAQPVWIPNRCRRARYCHVEHVDTHTAAANAYRSTQVAVRSERAARALPGCPTRNGPRWKSI
jgi:hypothetical protein